MCPSARTGSGRWFGGKRSAREGKHFDDEVRFDAGPGAHGHLWGSPRPGIGSDEACGPAEQLEPNERPLGEQAVPLTCCGGRPGARWAVLPVLLHRGRLHQRCGSVDLRAAAPGPGANAWPADISVLWLPRLCSRWAAPLSPKGSIRSSAARGFEVARTGLLSMCWPMNPDRLEGRRIQRQAPATQSQGVAGLGVGRTW